MKSTRKPNEVDHQIGRRLRKWRLAQDIDACDLAQRLGVTQQQLQKYEKGQTRIAASRLFEIAQTLNIPVHWFFREPTSSEDDPQLLTESLIGLNAEPTPGEQDCSGPKLLRHYLKIEDREVRRAIYELMAILVTDRKDPGRAEFNGS
jgi:transcriptional regulator with XRE-family HTH domain